MTKTLQEAVSTVFITATWLKAGPLLLAFRCSPDPTTCQPTSEHTPEKNRTSVHLVLTPLAEGT